MLQVTFDPQTFLRQRTGGISRLFTDLIAAFDTDPSLGIQAALPFTWVNNQYLPRDVPGRGLRMTPDWLPREVAYAPWAVRGLMRSPGADIVHHTYYSQRFLRSTRGALRACTVYDMIPEKFAGTEWFTGSHLAKLDYVRQSDLVICISDSTRRDLLECVGDVRGEVAVVHSAVGAGFGPDQPPWDALPNDYLLYVGGRKGYKDFGLLPQAIAQLKLQGVDLRVVVIGPSFTADERQLFEVHGVTGSFTRLQADDSHLRSAYSHALAVVQTSRYEGFGMTALEGMASGVPVVIANASSMPEVGGTIARYFEAGDAESLAEQVGILVDDEATRLALGDAGPAWASRFSVQAMAKGTAAAYKSVAELRPS